MLREIIKSGKKWKGLLVAFLWPFCLAWAALCLGLMHCGKGLYLFGNWLSGWKADPYGWSGEI